MGSVNKVILVGRLGSDPEVRYTDKGTPVVKFSVATSERWKDKSGESQEKTEWHRIVVWDKLGEVCARYLTKGKQTYVEGRLQTRQWEQDGQKRYMTEVVASSVTFLGSRNDSVESHGNSDDAPF
jgi:single-strand DNA-binding protein